MPEPAALPQPEPRGAEHPVPQLECLQVQPQGETEVVVEVGMDADLGIQPIRDPRETVTVAQGMEAADRVGEHDHLGPFPREEIRSISHGLRLGPADVREADVDRDLAVRALEPEPQKTHSFLQGLLRRGVHHGRGQRDRGRHHEQNTARMGVLHERDALEEVSLDGAADHLLVADVERLDAVLHAVDLPGADGREADHGDEALVRMLPHHIGRAPEQVHSLGAQKQGLALGSIPRHLLTEDEAAVTDGSGEDAGARKVGSCCVHGSSGVCIAIHR